MLTYEYRLKFWEINVIALLFMTCIFIILLNQKHLAQKGVTEEKV